MKSQIFRSLSQEPCPGQDKMREMMVEFLRVTKKTEAETETERIVVNNPDKYNHNPPDN